jgi:hypothetical protein
MQPARLHPVVAALTVTAAFAVIAALGSVAFLLTGWEVSGPRTAPAAPATTPHKIRFEVNGTGTAQQISWTVTWDWSVIENVRLPWSKEIAARQPTSQIGITATKADGSVRCRLLIDDKVLVDRENYHAVSCDVTLDAPPWTVHRARPVTKGVFDAVRIWRPLRVSHGWDDTFTYSFNEPEPAIA